MAAIPELQSRGAGAKRDDAPRPPANPYLAGFALGLVLLATFLVTGRGLGASGAFASVATWITGLVSPEHVDANAVHAKLWRHGAPLATFLVYLMAGAFIGALVSGWQARRLHLRIERGPRITDGQRLVLAFAGGFVAAYGAKIAKGCTSGQALTGGAMLNAGSLAFMLSVFVAAYALAYAMRKEWL
ncbi:MAG: YeeE/YedE thiosulfate transporter family protein [Betaproteobacteria bacterium]